MVNQKTFPEGLGLRKMAATPWYKRPWKAAKRLYGGKKLLRTINPLYSIPAAVDIMGSALPGAAGKYFTDGAAELDKDATVTENRFIDDFKKFKKSPEFNHAKNKVTEFSWRNPLLTGWVGMYGLYKDQQTVDDLLKHLNEYDADPETPGLQLISGSVDRTADLLDDARTPKFIYKAYERLGGAEGIAKIKAGMRADDPRQEQLTLLSNIGGTIKPSKNGKLFQPADNWMNNAADAYRTLQNYRTEGGIDSERLQRDLISQTAEGDKADSGLIAAHEVMRNPDVMKALSPMFESAGLSKQMQDDISGMTAAYAGLGRDKLRSLDYLQRNMDNESALFTDEGRKNIGIVSAIVNNQETMENIKRLNPDAHERLKESAGKLNFINSNYDAVDTLRQFSNNPLAFIFRNLFSGDASSLYSAIDSMGRIFNPGQADLNWSRYLGGDKTKDYASYLPWLQLLGNIRSILGGEGIRY